MCDGCMTWFAANLRVSIVSGSSTMYVGIHGGMVQLGVSVHDRELALAGRLGSRSSVA